MEIAGILVLAILVGVAVYGLTLRREQWLIGEPEVRRRWGVRGPTATTAPAGDGPDDSFAYERPLRLGRDARAAPVERIPVRTRLLGLIGLIAMVAFGGLLLAIALWQAGHFINQTIAKFLER